MTTWRITKPDSRLDYRCDLCGKPANTVHFVPWITSKNPEVLFACPEHDPGGYWLTFERLFDWDRQNENGRRGLELVQPRVDLLRQLPVTP